MSMNIFNRDDGNKYLNYAQIDKDFDSYWENEARNPYRNRIRIGRQYQATVPSLLKNNEADKIKNEKRETLKWTPKNELNEQQLQQYLHLAKAVSMFSKTNYDNVNTQSEKNLKQKFLSSENLVDNSSKNSKNLNLTKKNFQLENDAFTFNKLKTIFQGLSQFVSAHHPMNSDLDCKLMSSNKKKNEDINVKEEKLDLDCNLDFSINSWTDIECVIFAAALQACGKKFSSIKKEFLPWKSSKDIIDYYYLCLKKQKNHKDELIDDSNELKKKKNDEHMLRRKDNEKNDSSDDKKCNDLRSKLDARNAEGKDKNLNQCTEDINQIIFELLKASGYNINNLYNTSQEKEKIFNNQSSLNSPLKITKMDETNDLKEESYKDDKKFTDDVNEPDSKFEKSTTDLSNLLINQVEYSNNVNSNSVTDNSSLSLNLGSLNFYKDGQLVLKLNAKQEPINDKCLWEESNESIRLKNEAQRNKKKRLEINKPKQISDSFKMKNLAEDQDYSTEESIDEDSRDSTDSNLQQKNLINSIFKKAKVKVEKNYSVPLASPSFIFNQEDELNEINYETDSPTSKKIIFKDTNLKQNSSSIYEDDLKRKLRSKTNYSKNDQNSIFESLNNQNLINSIFLNLSEFKNEIDNNLLQNLQNYKKFTSNNLDKVNEEFKTNLKTSEKNSLSEIEQQIALLVNLPIDIKKKLIDSVSLYKSNLNQLKDNHLLNSEKYQDLSKSYNLKKNKTNKLKVNKLQENSGLLNDENQLKYLLANLNNLIEANQLNNFQKT